ncbi:MAG: hypothetical protein Q4C15_02495 [Eubacteriales bacterium]|jgi:hypothetical protein|nr:hypothetical protein [Oscillospiraceae bacterium]MDO4420897.1 hypothetical protein [Eubacteriales bacterium]
MKTEFISITPAGTDKDKALELTEKTAAFCGLDHKSALRLRLLSEELIELMRNFTGELKGDFWLEAKDSTVEIHLKTEIPMDLQTRKELLAVSTSGKNAAAKGFMGKIRDMISTVTLPDDPETKAMTEQALGLMALGCQAGSYAGSYSWSMSTYVASIEKAETIQVEAAKDELEKSIVANLADDVTVHIVNSDVEIAIYKSF